MEHGNQNGITLAELSAAADAEAVMGRVVCLQPAENGHGNLADGVDHQNRAAEYANIRQKWGDLRKQQKLHHQYVRQPQRSEEKPEADFPGIGQIGA